ncbi:hypothetical protein ACFW3D_32880 [Streptomyces sp. NPDC058864]
MPRPSDWNVLGLHGDPTPGDPVQIRLLVDDLVKIGTQARSIATAIDQVMNTADSSVFAGKTADALRGKVDDRLRNHINDVADSFWEVSQNLGAWANHIEDAQRRADGALSAARGLPQDDPQLEALRQTAQSAGTELDEVGNTIANAVNNASDIRLPISDCQVFWEMFQILAIILIVPALIFGGPVALLALGVNMTLFVKAAIDFARGDIGFLDLFLAGLGIIAPTTKALPIFAIGGLLKSGFKAALQWGRNGFMSIKDMVSGFRFATVFTGLRDVARISLTWVRQGGLWVMQNFHNVPALGGSVFVKGGLVVVQGVRSIPVVVRGWGSAIRAGAPGAWQNFRVFAQESWSSQMGGAKWTRLILPVTHTDIAEYGLKGALRMGFWDRGVMGRGVWDLPVGGTVAHTVSAVPMGPHGATPHLDLGHANINMARMDLENVRFGNFADTHTSVRPSSFSVAPVSTVDLTGLRVGTVNPVSVHGANAVFDNSTAGFRAVRHMDDVVDIAGTQMSRMRIDAFDVAPGQMSGGLGVSAAAPGGHVTHSSGLYVPGSAGAPVVHEGVDVAALVAKGNGGNLLAQGPAGVLTAPPGGTGAVHTALTGAPAPAPGGTALHDLLAVPGAPGTGTGAAHTALTGVQAPPSGAGIHDLLGAPGGTPGAHGPLTGVPGHQSGTGAAGGSAFDLLSGGAKGTPNNPVPTHIGSDLGDNVAGAARAHQAQLSLDEIVRPAGSGRPGSVVTDTVPGPSAHGAPAPGSPKAGLHGTPPKDAARSALDLLDDGRGVRPVDGPAFAGAPGTGKAVDTDAGHAFAGAPARSTDDAVVTPGAHDKVAVTGDGHVAVPLRQDPAPVPSAKSGGGRVHSHETELFHEVNLKLGKMGSGAVTVETVTAARQVLEDLRGAGFTKVDVRAQADQLAVHLHGQERGKLPGGAHPSDLDDELKMPGSWPSENEVPQVTSRPAPESERVKIEHVPSGSHWEIKPKRDDISRALIPDAEDLAVAHWLRNSEDVHVWDTATASQARQEFDTALRDLDDLRNARNKAGTDGDFGKALQHQEETFLENQKLFELLSGRPELQRLQEPQLAAVIMIERRALRSLDSDRKLLTDNLLSWNKERSLWKWAEGYVENGKVPEGLIDSVQKHLQQGMPLTVNRNLAELKGATPLLDVMLQDNKALFRNVWEVKGTDPGQVSYLNARGPAEESLGYPATVKRTTNASGSYPGLEGQKFAPGPGDRGTLPHYAAVTSDFRPQGASRYGSAVFHLKPEVVQRATFTPGDSFGRGLEGAEGVTGLGNMLPLMNNGRGGLVRLAFAEATDFKYDAQFRQLRDTGKLEEHLSKAGYFEAQIHGGVTWQDLDRVVLFEDGRGAAAMLDEQLKLQQFARDNDFSFTVVLGTDAKPTHAGGTHVTVPDTSPAPGGALSASPSPSPAAVTDDAARAPGAFTDAGRGGGRMSVSDFGRLADIEGARVEKILGPNGGELRRTWAELVAARNDHGEAMPRLRDPGEASTSTGPGVTDLAVQKQVDAAQARIDAAWKKLTELHGDPARIDAQMNELFADGAKIRGTGVGAGHGATGPVGTPHLDANGATGNPVDAHATTDEVLTGGSNGSTRGTGTFDGPLHGDVRITSGDGHTVVPPRQEPAPAPATGPGGGRVHSHETELFHEVNLKLGKMGSGAVTVETVTAARQVLEDLRGAAFTKVDVRAQADQLAVHLAGPERGQLPGGVRHTDFADDAPATPGPGGHHAPPVPPRPPRPESGLLDGLDDVDLDDTGAPMRSHLDMDDDSVPGTPVGEHGTEDLDGFAKFIDLIRPLRQHVEEAIDNPAANIEVALVASPGGRTWREFSDDVGHAMVAVILPGERQPLTIGFYPEDGNLFGKPGAIVNDAEYLVSGHVRVLGTYRITAAQLFDGYRYAMANSGAVYDLFRYNCVRFAEGFVSAALGKSVADLWVAAPYRLVDTMLRRDGAWHWADGTSPVAKLTADDTIRYQDAFGEVEDWRRVDPDGARDATDQAKTFVFFDHQRPLIDGNIATVPQKERLAILGQFEKMITHTILTSGDDAGRQLSRQLGETYGTLRPGLSDLPGPSVTVPAADDSLSGIGRGSVDSVPEPVPSPGGSAAGDSAGHLPPSSVHYPSDVQHMFGEIDDMLQDMGLFRHSLDDLPSGPPSPVHPGTGGDVHVGTGGDDVVRFMDETRPVRQHLEHAIADPAADIRLVLGTDGSTGARSLTVWLPGRDAPVPLGPGAPGELGVVRGTADGAPGGGTHVLEEHRITAAQLENAYLYAARNLPLWHTDAGRFTDGFMDAVLDARPAVPDGSAGRAVRDVTADVTDVPPVVGDKGKGKPSAGTLDTTGTGSDHGGVRGTFADDLSEIDASAAITDARRELINARTIRDDLQTRYVDGVGTSAEVDGVRYLESWQQVRQADAALAQAEAHWNDLTGGAPLPEVQAYTGHGLGGGAPRLPEGLRSLLHLKGRGDVLPPAPAGVVQSVDHVPSATHVVTPLEGGKFSHALVPSGQDLTVAHWLSEPQSAHGWPKGQGKEAYEGDLKAHQDILTKGLAGAEHDDALKSVLQQQKNSFDENVRLFQALEGRTELRNLRMPQLSAIVMAERRAIRTLAADTDQLTTKLRGDDWEWAKGYRLDGAEAGELITKVHKHLQEDLTLTVNLKLGNQLPGGGTLLDAMTADQQLLRNAWEIDNAGAGYYVTRGNTEEALGLPSSVKRTADASGIYPGQGGKQFAPTAADIADLPNYAALTSKYRPSGVKMYGQAVFHLKPNLMERATFTPADSFGQGLDGAMSVTGRGNMLPLLNHGPEQLVRLAFAEATDFQYDSAFRGLRDAGKIEGRLNRYFEAQLHGGVKWGDLDRVVLVNDGFNPAGLQAQKLQLEQFATDKGLSFTVEVHNARPGAAVSAPGAPPTPPGSGGAHPGGTGGAGPSSVHGPGPTSGHPGGPGTPPAPGGSKSGGAAGEVHENYEDLRFTASLLDEGGVPRADLMDEAARIADTRHVLSREDELFHTVNLKLQRLGQGTVTRAEFDEAFRTLQGYHGGVLPRMTTRALAEDVTAVALGETPPRLRAGMPPASVGDDVAGSSPVAGPSALPAIDGRTVVGIGGHEGVVVRVENGTPQVLGGGGHHFDVVDVQRGGAVFTVRQLDNSGSAVHTWTYRRVGQLRVAQETMTLSGGHFGGTEIRFASGAVTDLRVGDATWPTKLGPDGEVFVASPAGNQVYHRVTGALIRSDAPTRAPLALPENLPSAQADSWRAGVHLAQSHLGRAASDNSVKLFMQNIIGGAFTSKKGYGGYVNPGVLAADSRLVEKVRHFNAVTRDLLHEGANEPMTVWRGVSMDPHAARADEFIERLPASTSNNREFQAEWAKNGVSSNRVVFEIEVPADHGKLAMAYPPGYGKAGDDAVALNQDQWEVTLSPTKLVRTGPSRIENDITVIPVRAEQIAANDLERLITEKWEGLDPATAFNDFGRAFEQEAVRRWEGLEDAVVRQTDTDPSVKTLEISGSEPAGKLQVKTLEISRPGLAGKLEVKITHDSEAKTVRVDITGGKGKFNGKWSGAGFSEIAADLRGTVLHNNDLFNPLPVPASWHEAPVATPHTPGQAGTAHTVGAHTGGPELPRPQSRLTPDEIEQRWLQDGERVDALFDGVDDATRGAQREAWRDYVKARYDLGRAEDLVRERPGGSSNGPTVHQIAADTNVRVARFHVDAAERRLEGLGIDPVRMEREMDALYTASLRERPRIVAGLYEPVTYPAVDLKPLHTALDEHTKAVSDLRQAENELAQVSEGADKWPAANAKVASKEADELAARAAVDDIVTEHENSRHLTQVQLSHLVDARAGSGDVELALRLRAHALDLDKANRAQPHGSGRADQTIWSAGEIEEQVGRVRREVAHLENTLKPESAATPTQIIERADELSRSAGRLQEMLNGFVKDAAPHGGLYALRNEHGSLSLAADGYARLVDDAARKATPGEPVSLKEPFSVDAAVLQLRGSVVETFRKFRTAKAYGDVPGGTQWKTVLPGDERAWKTLIRDFDELSFRDRESFVRKLSEENITGLRKEVDELLRRMEPGEAAQFRALLDNLNDLDYRVKHATPAYHAIANSGLMASQGDLERRGVRFLASGKSSAKNTSNLGNDDFVFFRMEAGDEAMQTRYGPTTLIFDAKVLEEKGGWVSLHDQLNPLDRETMRDLKWEGKSVRTAAPDDGFKETGQRSRWTYQYPGGGEPRHVSFEQEVFHGAHAQEALSLSVVREVASVAADFRAHVFKVMGDQDALGSIVSRFFRPEAKFGSGLPINPSGGARLSDWPAPLKVVEPDGDGRYLADGTVDPIARAAGKQFDEASDKLRQAGNGKTSGHTGSVTFLLRKARTHAELSVKLTGQFLEGADGARLQMAERLLKERSDLLARIEAEQASWKLTVESRQALPQRPAILVEAAPETVPPKAGENLNVVSVDDLLKRPAKPVEDALATVMPKPNENVLKMARVLAYSDGFRPLHNANDTLETTAAVGLSKAQFSRAFRTLDKAQLVVGKEEGLFLTQQGRDLLLPAQPAADLHVPPLAGGSGLPHTAVASGSGAVPHSPAPADGFAASPKGSHGGEGPSGPPPRDAEAPGVSVPHSTVTPSDAVVSRLVDGPGTRPLPADTRPAAPHADVDGGGAPVAHDAVDTTVPGSGGSPESDLLDPAVVMARTSTPTGAGPRSGTDAVDGGPTAFHDVPETERGAHRLLQEHAGSGTGHGGGVAALDDLAERIRTFLARGDLQDATRTRLQTALTDTERQAGALRLLAGNDVSAAPAPAPAPAAAGRGADDVPWAEDYRRVEELLGREGDPRREGWAELTRARQDLGSAEDALPHGEASTSQGLSAIEEQLRSDTLAARDRVTSAIDDLRDQGIDPHQVENRIREINERAAADRGATPGAGTLDELPDTAEVTAGPRVHLSDSGVDGPNGLVIERVAAGDGSVTHRVLGRGLEPDEGRTVAFRDGGFDVRHTESDTVVRYNESGIRTAQEVPLRNAAGDANGLRLHTDLNGRGRPDAARVLGPDAEHHLAEPLEDGTVRVTDTRTGVTTRFRSSGHPLDEGLRLRGADGATAEGDLVLVREGGTTRLTDVQGDEVARTVTPLGDGAGYRITDDATGVYGRHDGAGRLQESGLSLTDETGGRGRLFLPEGGAGTRTLTDAHGVPQRGTVTTLPGDAGFRITDDATGATTRYAPNGRWQDAGTALADPVDGTRGARIAVPDDGGLRLTDGVGNPLTERVTDVGGGRLRTLDITTGRSVLHDAQARPVQTGTALADPVNGARGNRFVVPGETAGHRLTDATGARLPERVRTLPGAGGFRVTHAEGHQTFAPDGTFTGDGVRLTGRGGAPAGHLDRPAGAGRQWVDDTFTPDPQRAVTVHPNGHIEIARPGNGHQVFHGTTGHLVQEVTPLHGGGRQVTAADGSFARHDGTGALTAHGTPLPDQPGGRVLVTQAPGPDAPNGAHWLEDATGNRLAHWDVTAGPQGDVRIEYTRPGSPRRGEFIGLDPNGTIVRQGFNVLDSGRPTGFRYEVDRAGGTWRRTDEAGVRSGDGVFHHGTVDAAGAANGRLRLLSSTGAPVPVFERRPLPGGEVLDAFRRTDTIAFGRTNPRTTWAHWDSAGSLRGSGSRHYDTAGTGWQDVDGLGRALREYRDGLQKYDGRTGHTVAVKETDGSWTWHRFDGTAKELDSGPRTRDRHDSGWTDRNRDGEVVQRQWGMGHQPERAGQYQEWTLSRDGSLPGTWERQSPHGKEAGKAEVVDGQLLVTERWREQRPPVWVRRGLLPGAGDAERAYAHVLGDNAYQMFGWEKRPIGTGTGTGSSGLRYVGLDGGVLDLTADGDFARLTTKLHDGTTLKVGDHAGRPAHDPAIAGSQPWEAGGRTGYRVPGTDARILWRDEFTDATGVHRVAREGLPGGVVREYTDPPAVDVPAGHGAWVTRDAHGNLTGVRYRNPNGVADSFIEGVGKTDSAKWRWREVNAEGTALGPSGTREFFRGSSDPKLSWDDSFRDFDANRRLVRERRMLDNGRYVEAWRDPAAGDRWLTSKYERNGNPVATAPGQQVRTWWNGTAWQDQWSRGARHFRDELRPLPGADGAAVRLREVPVGLGGPLRVREYDPAAATAHSVWREFDHGSVVRERRAEGTGYLETDAWRGQWNRYDAGGELVAQRTDSGLVWERGGPFGQMRLVGNEYDYRGPLTEIRGWGRRIREAQRMPWSGTVVPDGAGPALREARYEPYWRTVAYKAAVEFGQEFVLEFGANLAVNGIVAAAQDKPFTGKDVLKAFANAAVSSGVKTGVGIAVHENRIPGLRNLGNPKTTLANIDGGKHPQRRPFNHDKTWTNEWAGNETPTRWRGGIYDFTFSAGTSVISGWVNGAMNAAVWGVSDANGNTVKLSGADAFFDGGINAAAALTTSASTALVKNVVVLGGGSRLFHRQGFADFWIQLPFKIFEKSIQSVYLTGAYRASINPSWYQVPPAGTQ